MELKLGSALWKPAHTSLETPNQSHARHKGVPLFTSGRKEHHVNGRSRDPPSNGDNVHRLASPQSTGHHNFSQFYEFYVIRWNFDGYTYPDVAFHMTAF